MGMRRGNRVFAGGRWALVLAAMTVARAETAILECTADGWAQVQKGKAWLIDGRSAELRLNGSDQLVLLQFRVSAIPRWKVEKATLLLHLAGGRLPARLGVSTVRAAWGEVEAKFTLEPSARQTVTVKPLPAGWLSLEVSAALAQELVDGRASGLSVREQAPVASFRFHARESLQFAPYLVVEGSSR